MGGLSGPTHEIIDPQTREVDVLARLRELHDAELRRVWGAYLAAGKHNDEPPVNEDR